MNKLTTEQRIRVLAALVEGNSIRATVRMTGAAKNTIVKLLADVGTACFEYQDKTLRGLKCERLQLDEIWCFCYAREKNVPEDKKGIFGYGDIWTWVAIDADTKLVPCWYVGQRTGDDARCFTQDLASRITNRPQITTDGLTAYMASVPEAFKDKGGVDFAQLVKVYGPPPGGPRGKDVPFVCVGATKTTVTGSPDPEHMNTSYVERQNLTMRMKMRRFTRLTNAFSKKVENKMHAIALHFMHYNFCRVHQTLRVTPAMAAGVADHVWELSEVVALLDRKAQAA